MGDRSNINFITDYDEDISAYAVINIYLHWGGQEALLDALNLADTISYSRRNDNSYFINPIIRKVTQGTDGGTGAGVTALLVKTLNDAYKVQDDNEHLILTFDFINQTIAVYNDSEYHTELFPLNHDGITEARQFITDND